MRFPTGQNKIRPTTNIQSQIRVGLIGHQPLPKENDWQSMALGEGGIVTCASVSSTQKQGWDGDWDQKVLYARTNFQRIKY